MQPPCWAIPLNSYFLYEESLVEWDLDAAGTPWPDCTFFGQVFNEVERRCPEAGLRFVLTKHLRSLPLAGDDVVAIVIGDEAARVPGYAGDVRLVAKTYGIDRPIETWRFGRGPWRERVMAVGREAAMVASRAQTFVTLAARTRSRAPWRRIIDLPLGAYLVEDTPFVPFPERSLDASFVGSTYALWNDNRRRTPAPKTRSRGDLRAEVEQLTARRPDRRVSAETIHAFHDAAQNTSRYSETMMDSRIALCPRGGSLETYRFAEALRFGCVPITEQLPSREYYDGRPGASVTSWRELEPTLDRLMADPARLEAEHHHALDWYERWFSPAAVAGRILDGLA